MATGKPASYYLAPDFKGRRSFGLDLHDHVFDPVFAYANAANPERPIQDAIRELLLQAVAQDARDGSIRAARIQAYREAQREIMIASSDFLRELAKRFELKALGDSANVTIGDTPVNEIGDDA